MKLSAPWIAPFVRTFLIFPLALGLTIHGAQGASRFWDTNGDGIDATYGGDGNWTDANWNTSATIGAGSLTNMTTADSAAFLRGTSGTVTISGIQQLLGVTFSSSTGSFTTGSTNYTLNGGVLDLRTASFSFFINDSNGHGTTVVNSDIYLLNGVTTNNNQRINHVSGSITLNGELRDTGTTGTHTLSLESYSGSITINGNITKAAGASGFTFTPGGSGTSNGATYTLGGNNTGLTGTLTVGRGTLVLNNSSALAGLGSGAAVVTVSNPNTTVAAADTINVRIGTGGVTINKGITFSSLTATDTSDVRSIGGSNTSGTATFSGTITLGNFFGEVLQVTAATGGTTVFSNNISDGSNSTSITKTGLGIVKFTRAAGTSFDGGTTVSAGVLLLNNTSGSGTGTGAVSVASTATLGGSGIIIGDLSLAAGGKFSPGDMDSDGVSGIESFDGAGLTWNSNDTTAGMLFDLDTPGTSDLLTLSGDFTKGTGSDFIFDFTPAAGLVTGTYTLVNFASSNFVLDDFSFTSSDPGLVGNFILNGTNLQFEVTSVPEPGGAALLGLAAGLVVTRRRRA